MELRVELINEMQRTHATCRNHGLMCWVESWMCHVPPEHKACDMIAHTRAQKQHTDKAQPPPCCLCFFCGMRDWHSHEGTETYQVYIYCNTPIC